MNPTNFSGLFGGNGGRRSLSKDDGLGGASNGSGGDAEMVTPLGQR